VGSASDEPPANTTGVADRFTQVAPVQIGIADPLT
jgi:hypothetical protein